MTTLSIDRQEQLKEIDDFIENSRNKLSSIVTKLGWSVESIVKDIGNIAGCPFDESHRIPESSLDKHLQDCQWKAEGYGRKDAPFSIPSLPQGNPSSIIFDEQLQDKVIQSAKEKNPAMAVGGVGRLIPRTSDRLIADFTREEKCAMYEYVIANTVEPDIGEDIADMNKPRSAGDGKNSSYLELLAQERNLKRRRTKYRGVHTNKKSQVEILRDVISQQMEMLNEYITEKTNDFSVDATNDAKKTSHYPDNPENFENRDSRSFQTNSENDRSKKLDNSTFHGLSSVDRVYDRKRNSSRDNRVHDEREVKNTRDRDRGNRRDSNERRSEKSHHKRHKHESKERHKKRHRSRDKSRDRKHDVRKESSRYSENESRRKRRSRS